ncbi:hypothetical protein BHE74_00059263 [Ensete ventricosum]|nr:hypothetical protein BHE74_00059263 [Ensete ventricosum]
MCPLRLVLVFLSAALAGFFARKSIRSPPPSPISDDSREIGASSIKGRILGAGKKMYSTLYMSNLHENCQVSMGRASSTDRLVAIALGLLAVLSPLYIDRKTTVKLDDEDDGSGAPLYLLLPLALILLVVVINLAWFVERRIMRLDPYWIHRFGGSSCGIMMLLLVLGVLLKCKASLGF